MIIDWPLVVVLFCLSIPGVLIAIKRLIYFLLPENSEELKKRIGRFAIVQTLILVFILCLAGAILSQNTGLRATHLEDMLHGKTGISTLFPILLPAIGYALLSLVVFLCLYHLLAKRFIDEKSLQIMRNLRIALGLDGCILYGGVVEEIIGRWGIMNLATFFAIIFMQHTTNLIIWISILVSSLIFSAGQIPAYLAAGCSSSRSFIYSYTLLSMSQSIIFGYVFWQYGLVCSIISHMLFHLGWAFYASIITKEVKNKS
ncbi:CPBP family intramembrane metalloprotease [Legionella saoudiensis]|uniref:CPBP family intramembrane metalloprotease n=1 Tax=Legionella saoudiensis TaxID=1750561 RepID=UPI000730753A|nr:CPBP family intramembrane metalloprotease [Legionella saoudiensis]